MSVKDELASVVVAAPKVRKAEVAVLLRCAGGLRSVGGRVVVDAEFDHRPTAERLVDALREAYGVPSALHEMRGRVGDGRYLVRVSSHAEDLARQTGLVDRGGRLVRGMPVVMSVLSVVGTAAMLWVGGHIVVDSLHKLGIDWFYGPIHAAEHAVHEAAGGVAGWLTATTLSAIFGLILGSIIAFVLHKVLGVGADKAH